MKRTLIALMALAGYAAAASLDYDIYKDDSSSPYNQGLLTVFDFDQGTAGSAANKAGGDTGGYSDKPLITYEGDNGYGTINSAATRMWKSDLSLGDFTISMDVNTMTAGHLLTMRANNTEFIHLTSSAESPLTLTYSGVTGSVESTIGATSGDKTLDWATITLVRSANILTLYVNGESQGSLTAKATTFSGLQIGALFGEGTQGGTSAPAINATIDNLTIWGKALSAAEVSSFVIPEPTTATLSLLALAGLAARRRRASR